MSVVAVRTEQGHTTLVGEYGELRAYLVALVAHGQLSPDGLLAQGRTPDGRCFARVRLQPAAKPRRRVRRGLVVAGSVAAAVLVSAAVWLLAVVVAWVVAHLVQIIAGAVVFGALAVWAVTAGGGKHCPGCRG